MEPLLDIARRAGKFHWDTLGFNYRLNEVASALGLCQLAKLDRILAERRRKAKRYEQAFAGQELVAAPWLRGPEDSTYQLYTVLLAVDQLTLAATA
jgi:dTDP-4-amino-4,6-dideoxygalactose transaminase